MRCFPLAAFVVATLLAGCASYRPAPLDAQNGEGEATPDRVALAVAAARLRHPRLRALVIDFAQPLTPEALGVVAVVANPELKAARAKAGVADAQLFAAGLLPDPQVGGGYDARLSGPDMFNGWAAQIALDLIALRDRRVSLQAERAARRQVRLDLAWQEWQVAGQARLLAARIAGLEAVAALDAQSRLAADQALTRVLHAAAQGDMRADDVEVRRIAAADAADRARTAERDLAAARLDLNRLLGLAPATRVAIVFGAPPPERGLDAVTLFATAKAERLDLLALRAGYDSQEAVVRKAVMDQFPALQLTLARAQDTAKNQTFGPQVSFTLPLWNRNRGGIALATAGRAELQAEYLVRLDATRAEIAGLVEGLTLERQQRAEVAAQAGPIGRIVEAMETAASRGDLARASGETARQSLVDKTLTLATLDQAMAEQAIALDIAVGAAVGGDPPPAGPEPGGL